MKTLRYGVRTKFFLNCLWSFDGINNAKKVNSRKTIITAELRVMIVLFWVPPALCGRGSYLFMFDL